MLLDLMFVFRPVKRKTKIEKHNHSGESSLVSQPKTHTNQHQTRTGNKGVLLSEPFRVSSPSKLKTKYSNHQKKCRLTITVRRRM
mmetsp:Transcript_42884/g.51490  ORF Transcript_42884/g.51490 Transcript_42884/m.51490 type:complete len:85 (-) Transcript_42884:466-720(-)